MSISKSHNKDFVSSGRLDCSLKGGLFPTSTKDTTTLIAWSVFCLHCQLTACSLLTWIIPTWGGSCAKIPLQIECTSFSVITDLRESPSASQFFSPGLYLIEKSYRDNSASHRCPVASSFAVVKTYVNGLLSVSTSNLFPYRYSWNLWQTLHFNAKNSSLCAG